MIKAQPFSRLLLNKMVIISLASVILALLMTGLSSFVLFETLTQKEIKKLQSVSEKEIDDHLATGWTPNNVGALFNHLNKTYPDHSFTLLKSPKNDLHDERNKLSTNLYKLLQEIETKQRPLTEVHLLKGTIFGGTPIIFESKCLTCHANTAKIGEYAGTLLFQMPLSSFQTSIGSSIVFIVIFLGVFLSLTLFLLKRFIVDQISGPLQLISTQLDQVRLDEQLEWQRSVHSILEVDKIDEAIHQNIKQFKHVFDKLDAVKVTEHETGFFLASHFNEALKFEIYRCQRYQHEFSIITLKLHSVRDLDKAQNRPMPQKILAFSKLIQSHIRSSDMPFRISENLFLVIAPEMSDITAQEFQRKLIERFCDTQLNEEMKLIFEVSVGFASYPMDAIESKGLTRIALERMTKEPTTLLSKVESQNLAAEPVSSSTQAEANLT